MPISKDVYNPVLGICFMLLHAAALAVVYVTAPILTRGHGLSSALVVFLYKFSILIAILPWCLQDNFKHLKTKRLPLHITRGFLSICGSLSLFYAMKHVNPTDATALGYLEQVVIVIIGMIIFKESIVLEKFVVILLSFLGALIVFMPAIPALATAWIGSIFQYNPSIEFEHNNVSLLAGFNYYYLFVLLAVGFWATNCTVIKIMGKTEGTRTQLFYVMLISSLFSAPVALMDWSSVSVFNTSINIPSSFKNFSELGLSFGHLHYIILLSLCYFIHSLAFYKSLQYAELSVVAPFDYSRILFTAVLGYLVLGEPIDLEKSLGYFLIVAAGVYLIQVEAKKHKKRLREAQATKVKDEYEHV